MGKETVCGELKIKDKPDINWREAKKKQPGEDLLKNLGVASALVLCAVTLKSGALPPVSNTTDAILTSVTDDTLLDDQLGKLTFVSTLFPEATLVFGESKVDELAVPVSGGVVVHTWKETEPYMSWRTSERRVYSSGAGVVMGVYHGENEERLVQVMSDSGVNCLYGNLLEANVQTGDRVEAGEVLGTLLPGSDCVLEVQVNGVSVDPAAYLSNVS